MMRHVGDPRLGLAALGDIDHRDQIAVAIVEGDAAAEGQHIDLAAVGLEMPPVARGVIDVADAFERLGMAVPTRPAARSRAASSRRKVARL